MGKTWKEESLKDSWGMIGVGIKMCVRVSWGSWGSVFKCVCVCVCVCVCEPAVGAGLCTRKAGSRPSLASTAPVKAAQNSLGLALASSHYKQHLHPSVLPVAFQPLSCPFSPDLSTFAVD